GEEVALGQADADMAGRYMITYLPGDEHGPALTLLVQAGERDVTEGALPCPAPPVARADPRLAHWAALPTVELARLRTALEPALAGANAGRLSDRDLETVACAATVSPEQVQAYAAATRLSTLADAPVELGYGLAREGIPLDPVGLLR